MELIKIVGIGIITAVLSVLLKKNRPEIALTLPVLCAAAIFFFIEPYLKETVRMFKDIAGQAGIEEGYLKIILKIVGASYLCQFSADLCRDAGEGSIASKIELGGKLIILFMSMPMVYSLLELIDKIINFKV